MAFIAPITADAPPISNELQYDPESNEYFIDAYDINGCYTASSVVITSPNPLLVNEAVINITCFAFV